MAPSCSPRGRALALTLGAALLLALAAAHDAQQETFDPDVDLNTPQTIRRYGYPAEAHVVQTADGYLLTVHRVPGPRFSNASDEGPAPPTPTATAPGAPAAATATATDAWTSSAAEAATNTTVAPWRTTEQPSGTEAKRLWTTKESPGTNTTAPPWTTEATSRGSVTSRATTAVTNGTAAPWSTAWTTSAGTTATSDPTSTFLPANTTTTAAATTPSTPRPSTTTSYPSTSNSTSTFPFESTPPTSTTPPTTAPPATATTSTTTTTTITTAPYPSNTTTSSPTTTSTTTTPTTTTTTTTTGQPPPMSRPVIFLQHGLLGSSYDWIVAGPGKGLAYLLADAGYDVWMGNARGNTYSRAHVYLPTESSSPFWDFSFHEMGIYDLPAVIDYILNTTGAPQLHYVGHSMGTTMFFVMASTKPEAAAGIASMHALAPVVYVRHIKSPIRLLAPFARDVEFLAGLLGDGEFLPQNKILHYLAKYGCELLETEKDVCENLIFILCGYDKPQFDTNILPVLLSHTPAGASTRTLIHYAQMIKSGKFQQYDLGKYGNLKKYRSLEPPTYDLSKVNVSVHLIYANNDWLAAPVDVNSLYQDLRCTKTKYVVPLSSFNHLDFILAKDVKTLLYDKLLKEIPREIDYQNYEDNFIYD